jgi:hypothetical protein
VSRESAPTDEGERAAALPGPGEAVNFRRHIKPLFRDRDRQSMRFAFDLWEYVDVKTNAKAILERLQNGSMPCDGPWPEAKVKAFARWIETGAAE